VSDDALVLMALALAGAIAGAAVSVLLKASQAGLRTREGRVNPFAGLALLSWWSIPLVVTALVAPSVLLLMALLLGEPTVTPVFVVGIAVSGMVLGWRLSTRRLMDEGVE